MYVVCKHDVKLAPERRHGPDVDVELEIDPQTQESGVDHDSISHCHSAQNEACRRLVEHWVLEDCFPTLKHSFPVKTESIAEERTLNMQVIGTWGSGA